MTAFAGEFTELARAAVFFTTDGTLPDESSEKIDMSVTSTEWQVLPGYVTIWKASIPPQAIRDARALPDRRLDARVGDR